MRLLPFLAALLPLLALAAPVQVRVEPVTYPVVQGKSGANEAPGQAAKLVGKEAYGTDAVILENEYLALTVLPELGGRLVHGVFKPTGQELFWVNDQIENKKSWSMGGCRWSFPFWEHGRHFDETCGYTIVRGDDGAATLAMDMRFDDFLTPAETKRYGRATNLRLAQYVTLRPGESRFTWTARVDNPLPVPYGFKLWNLIRQPGDAVTFHVPAPAYADHNAPKLNLWPATPAPVMFAINVRDNWAGYTLADRKLTVMRHTDALVAPGAKVVYYGRGKYAELWGGTHEVFEECGRLLPAVGSFTLPVTITATAALAGIDHSDERFNVLCRKVGGRWQVGVASSVPLPGCRVLFGATPLPGMPVDLMPDRPFTAVVDHPGDVASLAVLRGADVLYARQFPTPADPMPEAYFAQVQARIRGTMPGGQGLFAEATDLVSETQLTLVHAKAVQANLDLLKTSDDVPTLVDAARRLMRARKNSPEAKAGLEKALTLAPDHPHAHLLLAMWLWESGAPAQADAHLAKALDLPGGRYLSALRAVAREEYRAAEQHLLFLFRELSPRMSFQGDADPAYTLLQPGASFDGGMQPRLLLAIAQQGQRKMDVATGTLRMLVTTDPACIEAWMLLEDDDRVRTLTEKNDAGQRAAEANLAALQAGEWRGIGRP